MLSHANTVVKYVNKKKNQISEGMHLIPRPRGIPTNKQSDEMRAQRLETKT